jgi:hypothetical protein
MAQRLAGKVAVVTGGALGICGGRRDPGRGRQVWRDGRGGGLARICLSWCRGQCSERVH